jgi:hypothetical protein
MGAFSGARKMNLGKLHLLLVHFPIALSVAAAAVRGFWAKQQKKWMLVLYGVLMAALFVCISITGHLGGKIAFGDDYLAGLFG